MPSRHLLANESFRKEPWSISTFLIPTRPPKKTNMLSIKHSSMLMTSVSDNFLVESEWVVLQNKICPFLAQGIYFNNNNSEWTICNWRSK
jgi:hypothetical protein